MRDFSENELTRRAVEARLLDVKTTCAGEIVSFDANTFRARVRLAVRAQVTDPDSPPEVATQDDLLDVPVLYPTSGPFILYMPLTEGDPVRVEFSEEDDGDFYRGMQAPVNPLSLKRHGGYAVCRPAGFDAASLGSESQARLFLGKPGGACVSLAESIAYLGRSDASDEVALASLVRTAIQNAVLGHKHVVPSGTDAAGGFTAATTLDDAVGQVKAQYTKAK